MVNKPRGIEMQTVYLEPSQVPEMLRKNYGGKKYQAVITESVTINSQKWSGGSCDTYSAVSLETGECKPLVDPRPWPENMGSLGNLPIKPNFALVKHTVFSGKDMGYTFYIRADNATAILPDMSADQFTPGELAVLYGTRNYKASYNGQNRYQMTCTGGYADFPDVSEVEWNAAKYTLIEGKYLNKAGAITTKGRNAAQNIKRAR